MAAGLEAKEGKERLIGAGFFEAVFLAQESVPYVEPWEKCTLQSDGSLQAALITVSTLNVAKGATIFVYLTSFHSNSVVSLLEEETCSTALHYIRGKL